MASRAGAPQRITTYSPLLGTDVSVMLVARTDGERGSAELQTAQAEQIERLVVTEIERLEAVLSRFQPDSALERWKRGELDQPPRAGATDAHVSSREADGVAPITLADERGVRDFHAVMRSMARWHERTAGALDARAGALTALWRSAAERGAAPAAADIDRMVSAFAQPAFRIDDDGRAQRLATAEQLADFDLHAVGKGWIVDRAIERVAPLLADVALMVIAGGDLGRAGPGSSVVSIDDPLRRADNAPPIDRVRIAAGGVATSGGARRGFDIGGRRVSHVIDPRTGRPADAVASVSVLGSSCEAADAWATALAVAPLGSISAMADEAGVGVLAVASDGSMITNESWRSARSG